MFLRFFSIFLLFVLVACGDPDSSSKAGQTSSTDSTATDIESIFKEINSKILASPKNPELYHERANIFYQVKDVEMAIADMKRAILLDSTNARYHYSLGEILMYSRDFENGRAEMEKTLELDPDFKLAHVRLGHIDLLLRNYEKAIEHQDLALKIDPFIPEAYFEKGIIFFEVGDTTKAASSFKTAIEQDPDMYDAYVMLGLIYAAKNDDIALEYYNTAIDLQPQNPEPLYNKGLYCQAHAMYNEAFEAYTQILEIDSANPLAHFNMGYMNLKYLSAYEEATVHFKNATRYLPQYYQAYYNMGLAYENMNQIDSAVACYKTALSIKGDYTEAALRLDALLR